VLLSALIVVPAANARTLQIRDETHVLSAEGADRLRSVVTAAPFDARLVITTEYADAQDLSRHVAALVTEPNLVAVGVDPQHHHVQVHFGTASHVARAAWPAIEHAGNDAFRRGDWAAGAASIFAEATHAVEAIGGAPLPEGTARTPSLLGPGLLVLIVIGVVAVAAYFSWKRSRYGSLAGPGYGGPSYGGGAGYPMGPPGGGMGPLGGGIVGAGLGGLAGYELGKLEGEREGRGREAGRDEGQGNADGDREGNFDEGGGGSSWDDTGGGDGGDGGGSDF
jgi:hypothetical protein